MQAIILLNRGVALANAGNFPQAEEAFRQAIELNPDYAKAYSNLGFVLKLSGRLDEAAACLNQAIKLNPNFPDAYNNLSLVLMDTGRLAEAEACLRKALRLNPHSPEIYNNLGLVLEDTERQPAAEISYRRALELRPDYPDAYYNLGNLLKNARRMVEAQAAYHRAIELRPGFTSARFALSTLYLLQGRFADGWQAYNDLRLESGARQPKIPCWQGEGLAGRSILLYHEQGFGDTIQFIRYAEKVAESAAKTVLLVQKPLERLVQSSFPSLTVCSGEPDPETYDFACSLPNLPMLFNTSADTIPATIPYLRISPEISAAWHRVIGQQPASQSYKIGVVWAGNPKHHNDHNRSIQFRLFRQLFNLAQASWLSLQTGSAAESAGKLIDLSPRLIDFAETAGAIENLDLIITVDSAVAHLAGAMGKETWLLVPFAPDWRWQLDRKDSPWYPSMLLFRQNRPGDWREVLARVKKALEKKLTNQSQ